MKNKILIFIFFLFSQISFGQLIKSIKEDELLFEKALLLQQLINEDGLALDGTIKSKNEDEKIKEFAYDIKELILADAIDYYQELIDEYPKSYLVFSALYNKGILELESTDTQDAKITFHSIVDSKAGDKWKIRITKKFKVKSYTYYKNRATKILADLYVEEGNYKEAIKFLDLYKDFPRLHYCANENSAEDVYLTTQYAKCYLGLKDTTKALGILLPYLLENGLADNSNLVILTTEVLLKRHSKTDLKIAFENAFKSYKTEHVKFNEALEYERYYIIFLDTEIEFSTYGFYYNMQAEEIDKDIEELYKSSKFYKLLTE